MHGAPHRLRKLRYLCRRRTSPSLFRAEAPFELLTVSFANQVQTSKYLPAFEPPSFAGRLCPRVLLRRMK